MVHIVGGGGCVEAFGKGSVCSETNFVAVMFGLIGGRGMRIQLGNLGDATSNARGDHISGACWKGRS